MPGIHHDTTQNLYKSKPVSETTLQISCHWTPSQRDFDTIASWGLDQDPFAAIKDYSELKRELRWLNPVHRQCHDDYFRRRLEYIEFNKTPDYYYRTAKKPIDRYRWEYLMKRKAWTIMPLGWDNIPKQSCRVLDLGCGDGDTIQRVIHLIEKTWEKDQVIDRKIEVIGVDLNASRIENAKNFVRATHPNISVEFIQGDGTSPSFDFPDLYFDYTLCTGLIEVIDRDKPLKIFMDNLARVTKKGFYSEELVDKYPGGVPPWDLPEMLKMRGFKIQKYHLIFSEPFNMFDVSDPMKIWPISLDQNLYAEKLSPN